MNPRFFNQQIISKVFSGDVPNKLEAIKIIIDYMFDLGDNYIHGHTFAIDYNMGAFGKFYFPNGISKESTHTFGLSDQHKYVSVLSRVSKKNNLVIKIISNNKEEMIIIGKIERHQGELYFTYN